MTAPPRIGEPAATAVEAQPTGQSLLRRIDRSDLARVAVVALCAVVATAVARAAGPWLVPVAAVGLAVGCWPVLAAAWADVRGRRMSMELSMLIAIAAAAAIGEWVTALIITAFVLAAEILEDLSMDRGRNALADLMSFLPTTVQLRDGDQIRVAELQDVRVGQVVVVSPGGRVPVDGTVISGRSSLDQSRITGESLPVDVEPGEGVYAGSVNQIGALEIQAERVGAESSYGQIVAAVRAAQSSRAPVQRLADRLAGYLVYLALAGAAVTYLLTRDTQATISVVIVAGACGIAAGTPLAVLAAIGRAARSGAFIKDGTHLEELSTVDTVVFDKTGTLTEGIPAVVAIHPADGFTPEQLLAVAAAAEWYSEHPLGQAILAHARAHGLAPAQPQSFNYEPGRGLSARLDGRLVRVGNIGFVPEAHETARPTAQATAVHVAVDHTFAGTILLADTVRASARRCVGDLRALGLRVLMITGDSQATACAVAAQLGIDDVRAELLPADKLATIESERAAGRRIAMVGDGVNDAPALARANVGIAMGGGTEVARESADVVLVSSDLADLTRTVQTARRARRIVMGNFIGTITVDLLGMSLAALGLLDPVAAAVVHVASESAFILNSARLVPARGAWSRFTVPSAQGAPQEIARTGEAPPLAAGGRWSGAPED